MLNTQYRCHPVIGNLASLLFYENSLLHGENTSSIPALLPSFSRITFINNPSPEASKAGRIGALFYYFKDSFCNPGEEELIVRLLGKLFASLQAGESCDSLDARDDNESQSAGQAIGVISLYAAQCWSLQRRIADQRVQISTVDAFQGNEKDLIISDREDEQYENLVTEWTDAADMEVVNSVWKKVKVTDSQPYELKQENAEDTGSTESTDRSGDAADTDSTENSAAAADAE